MTSKNLTLSDRLFEKGPETEKLITVKEAADMLCISHFTLYGLASDGKIPRVKIGRCVRFRLSDIQKVVRS